MKSNTNGISPIYYNADADRFYRDVDGIRLVYEAYETHGAKYCGKLVGWYRPELEAEEQLYVEQTMQIDGRKVAEAIYQREMYARIAREMLE